MSMFRLYTYRIVYMWRTRQRRWTTAIRTHSSNSIQINTWVPKIHMNTQALAQRIDESDMKHWEPFVNENIFSQRYKLWRFVFNASLFGFGQKSCGRQKHELSWLQHLELYHAITFSWIYFEYLRRIYFHMYTRTFTIQNFRHRLSLNWIRSIFLYSNAQIQSICIRISRLWRILMFLVTYHDQHGQLCSPQFILKGLKFFRETPNRMLIFNGKTCAFEYIEKIVTSFSYIYDINK